MKQHLASTDQKVAKLLTKLESNTGYVGFDTEIAGPLLRGQDFTNTSYAALLGVSLAFEDRECYYLPIRHKGPNATFMHLHQVMTALQPLALSRLVWAHNAQFDYMTMLQAGYDLKGLMCSKVAAWLSNGGSNGLGLKELAKKVLNRDSPPYDPAMAHQTGAEVLDYACQDALNTLELGQHYYPPIPEGEMYGVTYPDCDEETAGAYLWFYEECDFALTLAKMKLQGIALDRKKLAGIREEAREVAAGIQEKWDKLAPFISITSAAQLQTLFEEGTWVEHGYTAGGAFQTNKEAIKHQLVHGRGDGPLLAALRLDMQAVNKVVSTYTDGLIEEALQWRDKKLHPDLWHFGTVTGRLSSSHPNIQNQPAHGDWATRIRECFIPDPGMDFTSADYSQVELRYFADYCGGKLLQAFVEGKDLHEETADMMDVSRADGKTVNFGFLLYGGGPRKLAGLLGIDEAAARVKIDQLQAGYPEVEDFRSRVISTVRCRGPIPWCRTRAGRLRYIPELDPVGWEQRDIEGYTAAATAVCKKYNIPYHARAGWNSEFVWRRDDALFSRGKRLVVNYLVQGGSRDLLVLGMTELDRCISKVSYIYPSYSVVTTVHDEVLIQHPRASGEEARELLKRCLEGAGPKLGLKVPIVCEPKTGRNWSEVK